MPTSPPSITLIVDRTTPRMSYACRLAFDLLLGIPCKVNTMAEEGEVVLHYTKTPPPSGGLWLQPSGWLAQEAPPAPGWSVPRTDREGFFFPTSDPASCLPYDPLASIAWLGMVGPQIFQAEDELDPHGRSTLCYHDPVAHHMAAQLAEAIGIVPPRREATWELTLDVDQPWRHAHKGMIVQWGALLVDFCLFRWKMVAERWRSIAGNDPYNVYGIITDACPPEKTSFFFLLDGYHELDSRFTSKNSYLRKLIQTLRSTFGYTIGIHPSYLSSEEPTLLKAQKNSLEEILGEPVTHSRQHYLRYRVPTTLAELEAEGIRREYSLGPLELPGFVNGFCVPHPWFNPWTNRESEMWLVPSVVMDRGLLNAKCTPEEGRRHLESARKKVREVGGHFVPILHNETFSDHAEWKGWTSVYLELIQSLKEKGV